MLRAADANARVIDVCASLVERHGLPRETAERFRGAWLAPLALHETSLEQVVLSDASNVFLKNPSDLRDAKGYRDTGTLFFHERVVQEATLLNQQLQRRGDRDRVHLLPWLVESFDAKRFGLPPHSPSDKLKHSWSFRGLASMEQDASLLLVDKRRARQALSVLWFAITELRFNVDVPRGPDELYWLAFEIAQLPYTFSPWGAASLSAGRSHDVSKFEATLCGALCQYLPDSDGAPELLFVHGAALIDPSQSDASALHQRFNLLPTHMTPRQPRAAAAPKDGEQYAVGCSVGLGKTEAPSALRHHLWRRRQHFMSASLGLMQSLRSCDMGGPFSDFSNHTLVLGATLIFHGSQSAGTEASPQTAFYRSSDAVLAALRRDGEPSEIATSAEALAPKARSERSYAEPSVELVPDSQGFIMCLHDDTVALGLSLIRELRCLENFDVVEIYCCNGDLSKQNQRLLREQDENVDVVDICAELVAQQVFDDEIARQFERSNWLKALAVHQSQLVQAIVLDADVLLLKDPRSVHKKQGYTKTGTVFFYDRVVNASLHENACDGINISHVVQTFDYARFGHEYRPSDQLRNSLAFRGETCHEQDSSMLAIKKTQFGADKAMQLLWFLATEHRFAESFSWGDKEAFWLAYELAHVPYFFSPWGASVVSATANHDLERHPETLCGSLAQYEPVAADDTDEPALLYVNGKALVDPVPFEFGGSARDVATVRSNQVFNLLPTHVTPRHQRRAAQAAPEQGRAFIECLTGLGSTAAPAALRTALWRRRVHFLSIAMGHVAPLASCNPLA
ncbi:hypothetical protein P43SY_008827 [Pythium insidiosum]|uniref:Nucleotide-diphospho-sugar transferase n=1 Tax=Pythium insidiosum TaxID=114742 RepID=A0AAD5M288_PYTIN|nr:hypothetical protein P43SY_008827 [Pythium insidiosum]